MYNYAGDGWGVDWGGGGSWQTGFNQGDGGNDGKSQAYQTGLNFTFGNFGVGGVMEYFNTGGDDNNAWVAGGGISYGVDAWTVGLQGSHGHYDGAGPALVFDANPGGSRNLDRVILTGNYALGPGVNLDAELGYTWFKDTGDAADSDTDKYNAVSVAIGSTLRF
jgi:hypothetical protein